MESCKPLADFYEAIEDDARIGSSHISVYMVLLLKANSNLGSNPFFTYRSEIIQKARISRRTFNKCMRELQEFGYIKYEPSSDPARPSKVCLNKLV